jgi:hypothetical protein
VDPLRSAIENALKGPISDDAFEECAVALLLPEYPSLVLLPGGSDFGLDGVTGEDPEGGSVGLVATTGQDAIGNLKTNLTRHLTTGGLTRRFVFATPRRLTPLRRNNLIKAAAKLGCRLEQVYELSAFTERLYRSPEWRKKLLAVPGAPSALSPYPAATASFAALPMVGRDALLNQLRQAKGDLVLAGAPGAGKTYLLRTLVDEGWAFFAVDHDRERLADAIRSLSPQRVIVDDAHLYPDGTIAGVRQLRTAMDATFDIVCSTWPGRLDDVRAQLGTPSSLELGLLERDQILELVKAVGVVGPTALLRLIVDQALGRPGLAVTLARACLQDRVGDVARGDALMRETVVAYRRLLDHRAASVMSVLALSGARGATLDELAVALALDHATAQSLVRGLAQGGTISESREGRLVILPEDLRYPLVADGFFGWPGSLPLGRVLKCLEVPSAAIKPLLGARYRGAPVPTRMLADLLESSSDPADFALYGTLGMDEALHALALAPWARRDIALASLGSIPVLGLKMLLEDAVGDDRALHSNPDHPLRQFEEYVTFRENRIERRRVAMAAIEDWISSGSDVDVALRAMSYTIRPGVQGLETDPGRGMTVTISSALLPMDELEALVEVVDRCVELVCSLEPSTYAPFLNALDDWCYPGRVSLGHGAPDNRWNATARRAVKRSYEQLLEGLPGRDGVRARLIRTARRLRLGIKACVDPEYDALFPDDRGSDWREAQRLQQAAIDALASSWETRPASVAAARIVWAEDEARRAGDTHQRQTVAFCIRLAERAKVPLEFVEELAELRASPDLLVPFMEAAMKEGSKGRFKMIGTLLEDSLYRLVGISMGLRFEVPARLRRRSIDSCDAGTTNLIEILAIRGELSPTLIHPLLLHPVMEVARATAIGVRDDVPSELTAAWEDAIVRCPADEYWYSVILPSRPALFARWLAASSSRAMKSPSSFEHIPHTVVAAIKTMSRTQRELMLRAMPPSPRNPWLDGVIAGLVGADADLYAVLLDRADLTTYHGCGLAGRPDESWFERANVAIEHGWSVRDVVINTHHSERGWSGEESDYLAGWIASFEAYRTQAQGRSLELVNAARAYFGDLRAKALDAEHAEAVLGLG